MRLGKVSGGAIMGAAHAPKANGARVGAPKPRLGDREAGVGTTPGGGCGDASSSEKSLYSERMR